MEEELNKLKQKIKLWEHGFKSREGRAPDKSDIDKSDTKEDYLRYNQLKIHKLNCNKEIDNKNKIPEWKKLSTKSFSLERNRKVQKESSVVKVIDITSEEIVNNPISQPELSNENISLTNDRPNHVHIPAPSSLTSMKRVPSQEDTQSPTRIPQHYNLVQKQKARELYSRTISTEWIDRHSADIGEDICNPNTCNNSSYNQNRNIIKEPIASTLFTRLYEVDTPREDTPLMNLGIEELIEKCSNQQLIEPDITHKSDIPPSNSSIEPTTSNVTTVECSVTEESSVRDDVTELLEESELLEIEHFNDITLDKDENIIDQKSNKDISSLALEITDTPCTHNLEVSEVITGQKRTRKSAVPSSKRPKLNNSLSDNFVRLDLRRKHYKAKGRGMSAKTYKRNMFKKKQFDNDRGGVSHRGGGMGKGTRCFKCGEVGHWARNCSKKVAENDLGKFAGEACSYQDTDTCAEDEQEIFESPLPTLEEAGLMAQGKTLTEIRDTGDREDSIHIPMGAMVTMNNTIIRQEIDPLFPEDMTQREIEDRLDTALKTLNHTSFREGQRQAVTRILQGRSTLVLLGTGGGKSLCYQLPAMMYAQRQSSTVLVVSPLVSLMEDQCLHMPSVISATCLHTNQTPKQREKILLAMKENKFSVILLSPEMIASQEKNVSEVFSLLPPIPFVCIDEVHCLSQWSHNFRPSYLRLCKLIKERFEVSCILALTATATINTVNDLMTRLRITNEDGVIKGPILPSNLNLSVSRSQDRDNALIELFNTDRYTNLTSIIVYCIRQKETERIAQLLRICLSDPSTGKSSISRVAECYHAGMTAHKRNQVQKGFMTGKLKIVVATLAFGMGLNKSDVRAIIHYNMPSSCENYVQEVGRAGRDGVTSYCRVFLDADNADLSELRKHAYANGMDKQSIKGFVKAVFPACECEFLRDNNIECPGHKVGLSIDRSVTDFDIPEGSLGTMLCYCEERGWIDLSRQQYDTCHIKCYGREKQLRRLAEKMPVIAAGIALQNSCEAVKKGCVSVRISEVSRKMGWEYTTLKRELGSLAYNDRGTGGKQGSSVIVEMTDLAYIFQMYHRDDNSIQDIVRFLEEKIQDTELMSLSKLTLFSNMLTSTASDRDETVFRERIRKYFEENMSATIPPNLTDLTILPRLRQEINAFITTHTDSKLTGRIIARIFQGISSPNYPAHMWGSTPYWRSYMATDFHMIRKMAEKELQS
ncbi:ATP-dependent DNA helicase Q4 [Oopsacas minuta]|uniref:DNA 3'-5' helicase n=1 Tax=Oopsacas minuta TaxID=111878 RepID=A0AAV7JMY9_9METZ|nr:ATP-dependent DNA helicase Q4 [Oopsacas minuta]